MLSIYDPYDEVFFQMPAVYVPLRHLASELLEEFDIRDEAELDLALAKAFDVCLSLDIPINVHFKKVFLFSNGELVTDWLLSDMGSYLLLINGNTRSYKVALAQLYGLGRGKKNA